MGLIMIAWTTRTDIEDIDFWMPYDATRLHHWRERQNLQHWMERLYRSKGGKKKVSGCDNMRLDALDIDRLEVTVKTQASPPTTGFYFGASQSDAMDDDLVFIAKARGAMKSGLYVFYNSLWR